MSFSKKDLVFSIITGLTTGIIAWRILGYLHVPEFRNLSFAWLVILIPILWIVGVNLGYFLGKRLYFFNQFGKFSAIGFTNAAVDFGVLNLLIAYSGIASGIWFSVFKGISFIFGITHSYFWNKYWSFEATEGGVKGMEFLKFMTVAIAALLINVGVASFMVNFITPFSGYTLEAWANIGAVVGSATALVVSFIGFKIIVFKK